MCQCGLGNSKVPKCYNQPRGSTGGKKIKSAPINEHVKQLRKELLHLNQTEFGRKIGIGQQSIANIEIGTNALTERNFGYGVGEVFIEQKKAVLQSLVREFELEPETAALVEALLELPPEFRADVVNYVKEAAAAYEIAQRLRLRDKTVQTPPQALCRTRNNQAKSHMKSVCSQMFRYKG